jgi:NDP-sugar pyrophosphorylase family protein
MGKGAKVLGGSLYLDEGHIHVGEGTVIQSGSGIAGPTVLGPENDIRQGTFLRGSIVTGKGCVFRGEVKNAVFLDETNFPHPSYVGDSILGFRGHFGNQATTANLGIFEGMRPDKKFENLTLSLDGKSYDIGGAKMGIVLGDYSQVGCNSVSDPGTLLGPRTIVYSLTRISKGFYGPDVILKNKPMEKGIVEISELN